MTSGGAEAPRPDVTATAVSPPTVLEDLTTTFHDMLCRCGGRCHGWDADHAAIEAFFAERFGSAAPLWVAS